jgi:hypothetical protein
VSNVALVADILPDVNGDIEISITPGPNNTNGSKFWYIGAMSIEVTTTLVPEPSTLGLIMFSGMAMAITRRKR